MFSVTMARSSQDVMLSRRQATRTQPGCGDAAARSPVTNCTPRQISATTLAYSAGRRATSTGVAASSSVPRWGGPPARARSQNVCQISSQATCPSGPYFRPAEPIETGRTSS